MDGNAEANNTMQELKGKILLIPQVDETFTKKGYSADAKLTGEALEKKLDKTSIVDVLTSEDKDKPLSAKQGNELRKMIQGKEDSEAANQGYDNTASGLSATTTQGAIDEVVQNAKVTNKTVENLSKNVENKYPKTGGMIDGPVSVRNADNGHGRVMKNNSTDADYGTQLEDVTKDGKSAKISVSALLGLLTYTDADGEIKDIFHEGNKPFGSYTGNGSAVTRIVETKGIGRLILVYNSSNFSFVTPQGALTIKLSDGTIKWIDGAKAYFLNGTLGITTSNEAFNTADTEYYYQVI